MGSINYIPTELHSQARPAQSRLATLIQALRYSLPITGSTRVSRVIIMLLLISTFNLFDLMLTLNAKNIDGFGEVNLLACAMLNEPAQLVVFKLSMPTMSLLIFLYYRRHWLTEVGCWVLCVAYTILTFVWLACLDYYTTV